MKALSDTELLSLWEMGADLHAIDRALLILSVALPELSQQALQALSIGQRNRLLLLVRSGTLGPCMESQALCPSCQERLEFALDIATLLGNGANSTHVDTAGAPDYELVLGEYALRFRLPDSRDLAAIVTLADPACARALLLDRCVVAARHAGQEILAEHFPEALMTALTAEISRRDPHAELLLDLSCPACQHRWHVTFDIVTSLWIEIAAQVLRLLREVDAIARVYGWSEAEILALSPLRRRCYLEMVT